MKLKKHLEKVFKNIDKEDKKNKKKAGKELPKSKVYCNKFKKGEDGFCVNYIGCKVEIESCARGCNLYKEGERCENRRNTKSSTAKGT